MSLNDSFIKEVSEEVRRDKLFKYLKKYLWFGIVFIVLIISAVAFNEWKKNNEKINYQLNGDELNLAFKKISEDQNFDEYIAYIEQNKPGSILAALSPIFLDNENNIEKKLLYLKNIENNENSPQVLRDLSLFYQFYLGNSTYDEKFQILNELSGPDKPFRLLAVEGKIDLYLEKGLFKEALQEINIVQPELSNSFSLNNRLKNLKIILETLIK
ncbi:MAG: hypothetical protein ACJ0DD_04520 [Paracoccaceae bacterium]